jgi:hypothetical protein
MFAKAFYQKPPFYQRRVSHSIRAKKGTVDGRFTEGRSDRRSPCH